jgi:trehalose 6-phosphate phosphatase
LFRRSDIDPAIGVTQSPALSAPPTLTYLQAAARLALFLDFDGTLVEIAKGPDAIAPGADLGKRLHGLSVRHQGALAVVSGRSVASLRSFLGDLPLVLAGSHGGHVVDASGATLSTARELPAAVQKELEDFAGARGLLYEGKTHGAALHFRAHPELAEEATAFARQIASRHALATKSGKCVIELVQPGVHKGAAVELLMAQPGFAGATPVFIGDDVTDEDGFAACERLGGFGVIVGHRVETRARYCLEAVRDVLAWLSL